MKMGKTFYAFFGIAAFFLASCVSTGSSGGGGGSSSGRGQPPEVRKWVDTNSATVIYGMGISTQQDESIAYQQASTLSMADLSAKLETRVAGIRENYLKESKVGDESSVAQQFQASTKQITLQTLERVKTYGPFMNNQGSTYLITYLDEGTSKDFDNRVHKAADEILGQQKNETDALLNSNN